MYSLKTVTASKWFHPGTAFFLVLWLALLCAGRARMFRDPGTFWHTVVGERMLQSGELVRTDSFSFTCYGRPWIAQQWLGECAMALVHQFAGLDGLLLAAATLLAAVYTYLAGRLLRAGLSWPAAALLVVLVIAASSYHFLPRPHLVTIALMAWTLGQLCDVEAGRTAPRRLFILPVVFVFWTNIHGGVLGGIVTAVVVLIAWLLRLGAPSPAIQGAGDMLAHPRPRVASPTTITLVVVLSVLTVVVNPYGLSLPRIWLSLVTSKVLPKLIIEHAPLHILSIEGAMIGALALVYLAMLAGTLRPASRAGLAATGTPAGPSTPSQAGLTIPSRPSEAVVPFRVTWLVPLLWLVMALMRVRHGPLFAVAAGIAIADMLPSCKLRIVDRWRAAAHSRVKTPQPADPRRYAIPIVAVLLAFALQATGLRCPVIGAGWSRLDPDYWPVDATNALCNDISQTEKVAHSLAPDPQHPAPNSQSAIPNPQSPVRVFNHMRFGGYLIYHVSEVRVYIDDRCELYSDEFLLHYAEMQKAPRLIEAIATDYDIAMALVKTRSPLDKYLADSPAWTQLHHDPTASLYACARQRAAPPPR